MTDGVLKTTTDVGNTTGFIQLAIGKLNGIGFIGYIEGLRITKGVARYISDFNPPIKYLPAY